MYCDVLVLWRENEYLQWEFISCGLDAKLTPDHFLKKLEGLSLVLMEQVLNISRLPGQICLFGFCLTPRSTIFQSCWDGTTAFWVFTSTLGSLKRLAQEIYTAVVGFEI